jgi:KRAB domain-containing zinc finger protein
VHKRSSMGRYVWKKHIPSHREEQELACDVCKKIFKYPSALKLHVCSYTVEKPFTCDVCNRSFMMSGDLNAHLHTHVGRQPFTCGVCKKILQFVRCLEVASVHSYWGAAV